MEYRVRRRNIESLSATRPVGDILTDAVLRRFHIRAGITTTTPAALDRTRQFYCEFLQRLIDAIGVLVEHSRRRSIRLTDVVRACRHYGIRLYGYDDMCTIEGPWGIEEFHVTELVEAPTTFSRNPDAEEPDQEPLGLYPKTDFVANQAKWNAEEGEEDWSSDDSEWTWFGDSDAESEDDDCEDDNDIDVETRASARKGSSWREKANEQIRQTASLELAQSVVDHDLLVTEPESEVLDEDSPMGQGYYSDCDASREPVYLSSWAEECVDEDANWCPDSRGLLQFDDSVEPMSDAEDSSHHSEYEHDANEYLIARQVFMDIFYSTSYYSLPITAVALSALHNVSEQYLHASLSSGVLRAQVATLIMEEQARRSVQLETELNVERQKVEQAENTIFELHSTHKSMEQELLQQIAELQDQLRMVKGDKENINPAEEHQLSKRVSPGKRKTRSKEQGNGDKDGLKATVQGSMVGSLRSRLQEYSLRKKAKITPI